MIEVLDKMKAKWWTGGNTVVHGCDGFAAMTLRLLSKCLLQNSKFNLKANVVIMYVMWQRIAQGNQIHLHRFRVLSFIIATHVGFCFLNHSSINVNKFTNVTPIFQVTCYCIITCEIKVLGCRFFNTNGNNCAVAG